MKKKAEKSKVSSKLIDDHNLYIETEDNDKFIIDCDTKKYIINLESSKDLVDVVKYRGCEVPVYIDDYGQCFYGIIDNEEISFGTYNTEYEDRIKYLIDKKLDVVHVFKDRFFGARLKYFDNDGFRDLELVYRGRILKVWPILVNLDLSNELIKQAYISESEQILKNIMDNFYYPEHLENID